MELIADGVLILAALAATAYCMVLSRRLRRLSEMDGGLGAAIKTLSSEVDHLSAALAEAKTATSESATDLGAQCRAANVAARRLEALVKSANKAEIQRQSMPKAPSVAKATEPLRESREEAPVMTEASCPAPDKAEAPAKTEASAKPAAPLAKDVSAHQHGTDVTVAPKPAEAENTETASKGEPEEERQDVRASENAVAEDIDPTALNDFIGAIISKADVGGDNAALARRLVMALSHAENERRS